MMDDQELLNRHQAMRPAAINAVKAMPNGVHSISDPSIIIPAWGPRRVSGRRRGMELDAYPESVTAHKAMWLDWLNQPRDNVIIVIAKKKAQARIDAALGKSFHDPEDAPQTPLAQITQDEIDDMMAEREELRAARQFADADKIRDYLTSLGVVVADQKVQPLAQSPQKG